METVKVGMREFRDNLASYILTSDKTVAVTRHGDTVGYFIPTRRKRTEEDRARLCEAGARLDEAMKEAGATEDEIIADFQRWRKNRTE